MKSKQDPLARRFRVRILFSAPLRDEEVAERHRGLIDSLMKKFKVELH